MKLDTERYKFVQTEQAEPRRQKIELNPHKILTYFAEDPNGEVILLPQIIDLPTTHFGKFKKEIVDKTILNHDFWEHVTPEELDDLFNRIQPLDLQRLADLEISHDKKDDEAKHPYLWFALEIGPNYDNEYDMAGFFLWSVLERYFRNTNKDNLDAQMFEEKLRLTLSKLRRRYPTDKPLNQIARTLNPKKNRRFLFESLLDIIRLVDDRNILTFLAFALAQKGLYRPQFSNPEKLQDLLDGTDLDNVTTSWDDEVLKKFRQLITSS